MKTVYIYSHQINLYDQREKKTNNKGLCRKISDASLKKMERLQERNGQIRQ